MSDTTPINGLQIPLLSDVPDIETTFHPFANAVDGLIIARYADITSRNTANPSPVTNQMCWVTSTGELYRWNGSAWVSMIPRTIFQTTDRSVTDNITPQNHPDLVFSVEANSKYVFTGSLRWKSTGTEGNKLRTRFFVPSGANGSWSITGPDTSMSGADGGFDPTLWVDAPFSTEVFLGTPSTALARAVIHGGLTVSSTAGNLQFAFAEVNNIGGTTSVVVAQFSWLQIWKVA